MGLFTKSNKPTKKELVRIEEMLALAETALKERTKGTMVFIAKVTEVDDGDKHGWEFDALCQVHNVPRHVVIRGVQESFQLDPVEMKATALMEDRKKK